MTVEKHEHWSDLSLVQAREKCVGPGADKKLEMDKFMKDRGQIVEVAFANDGFIPSVALAERVEHEALESFDTVRRGKVVSKRVFQKTMGYTSKLPEETRLN